nr:MAG TPA: hypothetical protein [Caudoviricetes sp.]
MFYVDMHEFVADWEIVNIPIVSDFNEDVLWAF